MRIILIVTLTYIMGMTTGLLYNSSGSSKNMNITVQMPPTVIHKDTIIQKPDVPYTVVHCTYYYKGTSKYINSMWQSNNPLSEKEIKEHISASLENCYGFKIKNIKVVEDAWFEKESEAMEYYKYLLYKK